MSRVDVEVDGIRLGRWKRYSITSDMMAPADSFRMSIGPVDMETFDHLAPDAEVVVRVDGTTVLSGYIDERRYAGAGDLEIMGRDKGGRLVDESMPLTSFRGMQSLDTLARAVVSPHFKAVSFSNADNRTKLRGAAGRKAASYGEPAALFTRSRAPKKVEPGEMRWDVLMAWLEPSELLAWSTADGTQMVIGKPNYSQATQYHFVEAAVGSAKRSNCRVELVDSVAERYSQITVVGASRGTGANYGRGVTKHRGVATTSYTDFTHTKALILSDDDVKSAADAADRASREMAIRDATARTVTVTTDGHGQRYSPEVPETLYAIDTVATLEIETLQHVGRYIVVAVEFTNSARGGEQTRLTLAPEGTVLTQ